MKWIKQICCNCLVKLLCLFHSSTLFEDYTSRYQTLQFIAGRTWPCEGKLGKLHFTINRQKSVQDNQQLLQFCGYRSVGLSHSIATAWKVSKYGVFLARIFPYLDWIRIFTSKSLYSVQTQENTDQKNSVFEHFPLIKLLLLSCILLLLPLSVVTIS